jgi:tetratricopeptide (TPR) repeat protein
MLFAASLFAACGGRPAEVSPNEIPVLEAQLAEDPDNGDVLLRYSAALFSAGRCDTASVVAARGAEIKPRNAIAPLVVGQCFEQANDFDQAIGVYQAFVQSFPNERGSDAVRAREMLALRSRATLRAQQALAGEAQLGAQAGDPRTLAVLPIEIAGDSIYQPLGRGLAQIFTADLALLQQFRLVERMQVQALFDEMDLSETARIDEATAVRMGRLLAAGRMVQGLAQIPDENDVQLNMAVVDNQGVIANPSTRSGRLRDVLRMEKEIVVELAAQLGYQLSEAERRAILENGTENLAAFLAYSNGLVAEDLGDFSAAAMYYQQAVQSDPGFQQAREQYRANTAAPAVQEATAGQVTTVSTETVQQPDLFGQPVADAVSTSVADVAATTSESTAGASTGTATGTTQTTQQATNTPVSNPDPIVVVTGVPSTLTGVVRVIFRLP